MQINYDTFVSIVLYRPNKMKLIGYVIVIIMFFLSAGKSAASEVFSDDFSSGLTKWEVIPGNMSSSWTISNGALTAYLPDRFKVTYLVPKNQYWNSDWKNYRFSFDYYPTQGVDKNLGFGFVDSSTWYEIHFYSTGYEVLKLIQGQTIWVFRGTQTLSNGTNYHLDIEFNEGIILLYKDGQLIIDLVDPTFSGNYGKPVLKATTGAATPTRVTFDNVVVSVLEPQAGKELPVPLLKQTDPTWAWEEYNSAASWASDPTIKAWGCAMTSAAMVFQYYGITHLPDGSLLTPSTLNIWLKNQVDGYIGAGLTNWLALTRLAKQMHDISDTPKLEYSRVNGNSLQAGISEIDHDQPVIMNIPGHFVVGKGYNTNQTDFLINDPAYSYTRLSEHNTQLLSTRIFTPSNTDLSYLLFIYQPELDVSVSLDGQELAELSFLAENINAFESQEAGDTMITAEITNPDQGIYKLTLSKDAIAPSQLDIFGYSSQGEVIKLSYEGLVGPLPVHLYLAYDPTGEATIFQNYTFHELIADLEGLFAADQLYSASSWLVLNQTVQYALDRSASDQLRYLNLFEKQLYYFENQFSETGLAFLKQQLSVLRTSLEQ